MPQTHRAEITITVSDKISYDDLPVASNFCLEEDYFQYLTNEIELDTFFQYCVYKKLDHAHFSGHAGRSLKIQSYLAHHNIYRVTFEVKSLETLPQPQPHDAVLGTKH